MSPLSIPSGRRQSSAEYDYRRGTSSWQNFPQYQADATYCVHTIYHYRMRFCPIRAFLFCFCFCLFVCLFVCFFVNRHTEDKRVCWVSGHKLQCLPPPPNVMANTLRTAHHSEKKRQALHQYI
jgi:hypothetical protein